MVSVPALNVEAAWDAHKKDFSALIQIPSVYDKATAAPGMPYGKPVRQALDFMKALCEKEGFQIQDYEGAAFSASWGKGERIDIVSHLDVVQVDGDWEEDPFSGLIHDGYVHGRGSQDMKSGAFLSFLALKMVKDSGILPQREIRLVYGSDEERTMDDMRLYVKHAGLPAFTFTPDGRFPMVVGEKGALMWTMKGTYHGFVRSLTGGIQPNVIAPSAEADIAFSDLEAVRSTAQRLGISAKVSECPQGLHLTVGGKAAHASRPEDGRNATVDLLHLLSQLQPDAQLRQLHQFFRDPYGAGAHMAYEIPPMGKLSLNLGILRIQQGTLTAHIDCRYPHGVTSQVLTDTIRNAFPAYSVELPYDDPPTLVAETDPYIAVLKAAYEETTGQPCGAEISGGVSYSKVFGHSVTFGTVGAHSVGLAHQKNEKISEADCIAALKIYVRTIQKLVEVAQ